MPKRTIRYAVAILSLALVLGGQSAAAPPDRMITVGLLSSGPPQRWAMIEAALAEGLAAQGYVEGKNLVLLRRNATFPDHRMAQHVEELLGRNVDAIVTTRTWSTGIATRATRTTPIIMGAATDPVGSGFVKSLAQPGTNVTGSTGQVPDLAPKMLDTLRAGLPDARIIGVLRNTSNAIHDARMRELEAVGRALDLSLVQLDLRRFQSEKAAQEVLRETRVQALLVLPDDDLFWEFLGRFGPAAESMKIPTFFPKRDLVEWAGGLMSYGPHSVEVFRRSAVYVDKIVNGAKPHELPVEQPTQLELALNLKRAQAYGITFPRSLLMRADATVR